MTSLGQKVWNKLGGKKRQKSAPLASLQRWPSNQQLGSSHKNSVSSTNVVANGHGGKGSASPPFRPRSKTFTDGVTRPRQLLKNQQSHSALVPPTNPDLARLTAMQDDIQQMLSSPRHYCRRKALIESQLQEDVSSSRLIKTWSMGSEEDTSLTVTLDVEDNQFTDSVQPLQSHTLLDMIEFLLNKHDVDLKHNVKDYHNIMVAYCASEPVAVKLEDPSTEYASCCIEIKAPEEPVRKSCKEPSTGGGKDKAFSSVRECLEYFEAHRLEELPQASHGEEESYHLPRVTPLDPIPEGWGQLPIDPEVVSALTDKEVEQQRAIWELIYTEFTHIQTLETIINVFMRCLELIRRVNFLKEDNYHNIFGYMEDLYHAHEQLWTYTFEPCLNKTIETKLPLDLEEIINRFPQSFGRHFERYEQHCALDRYNANFLNKAMQNPDFSMYLKWCEARPECNRLELKQMLVTPMQRITRYTLLLNAIAKKTTVPEHKESLEKLNDDISMFVRIINNTIRVQEETERVTDAMNRLVHYNVVELPNELKDIAQSHVHLDLLAPMPDVELDKPRVLMVEGSLHYRDSIKQKPSAAYVFLFTDMLLITKQIRKASNKCSVIRPPIKITSLKLDYSDSDSICCLVLNDYNTISSWFILKANSASVAKEWMGQITAAQQFYQDAVEKKIQTGKMIESLRSERILNGIENLDSLNTSLSQSLWSLSNHGRLGSLYTSNESLLLKRTASSSTLQCVHPSVAKTNSADVNSNPLGGKRVRSMFKSMSGSMDLTRVYQENNLALSRTTSVGVISQRPHSLCESISGTCESKLPGNTTLSARDSISEESFAMNESERMQGGDAATPASVSYVRRFPVSDDSGTEGSDTPADESSRVSRGKSSPSSPPARSVSARELDLTTPAAKQSLPPKLHNTKSTYRSLDFDSTVNFSPFVRHKNTRRKKNLTKRLSDPRDSTGSLSDLSELTDSSQRIDHLGLKFADKSSGRFISRTPSPRLSYKPTVEPSIASTQDSAPYRSQSSPAGEARKQVLRQRHSVGPLDSPDLNGLLYDNTLYSLHEDPTAENLMKPRSRSESSLSILKPDSSYLDIYTKRAGSQKPNVATVAEEEEVSSNNSNDFKKEFATRMSDSTSDDVDTPKSSKSKVMFSDDLTEVHSFNNSQGSDSELDSTPNSPTLQLIPGWRPNKKNSKPASIMSEGSTSFPRGQNSSPIPSSPLLQYESCHFSSKGEATETEDIADRTAEEASTTPRDSISTAQTEHLSPTEIEVSHESTDQRVRRCSVVDTTLPLTANLIKSADLQPCGSTFSVILCTNNNSNTESPPLIRQKALDADTADTKSRQHQREDQPLDTLKRSPRTTRRSRRESRQKPNTKSVKELSKMFDSTKKSSSTGLAHHSGQKSAAAVPSIKVTSTPSTAKSAANVSTSSRTHTPLKRISTVTKPEPPFSRASQRGSTRKESVSKMPHPRSSDRRKSRVSTTTAPVAGKASTRSSTPSPSHSRVKSSPRKYTISVPEGSTSKSTETLHVACEEKSPRILRSRLNNSISKPKPTTKKETSARAKYHTSKQSGGSSGSASPHGQSNQDILQTNSNCSNNVDSCSEVSLESQDMELTLSVHSLEERELHSGQELSTIYHPRWNHEFDKRLKQHMSFSDSSLSKTQMSSESGFKHPSEWANFSTSLLTAPLSTSH